MRLLPGFLLLSLFSLGQVYAQPKADSLMAVLDTARNERKVKTLNELFRAHIQSDPVKAIGYAREALNLGTQIKDSRGTAAAYNNIGVAYRNQGALDKSLEYYIHSLRLYDSLNNKEGIATAKNNISNIYSIKSDFGQALKYLEESHQLLIELGDEKKLVGSLNNLGNLNNNLELYEKALDYFTESFQLSEKLGDPFPDPLNNVGNVYFRQNNFQRAIEYYLRALELEKEANNRLGMLNTLANIGIAYTKANQPQPALKYLNDAYLLARELSVNSEIPDILKNSSYNFYRMGNLGNAYELLLKYDSAREKIYGEESSMRIAQMEMALQLSDKEREYENLKKTAELKTLQLRNSRLFIVAMFLGAILLIAIINYYFTDKIKEFLRKR
jgi:tetratricopeptide (TPR) repeat protein